MWKSVWHWSIIGVIGFCVGQGAVVMWPEWSAWTWWGLAAAFIPLLAVPTIYDHRERILTALRARSWKNLPRLIFAVIREVVTDKRARGVWIFFGFAFVILGLLALMEFAAYSPVAYPPDGMKPAEANRILGRCKMASIDAVASMRGGTVFDRTHQQNVYWAACLLEAGFRIED